MTTLNFHHDRAAQWGRFRCHLGLLLSTLLVAAATAAPNQALKLDGQDSYVELPSDLFKDLNQATVEAWARWDAFGGYSRVFEFGAPWHSMSVFNHEKTSDLRFNLYPVYAKGNPDLTYRIHVAGVLHTNEWVHLAAVSGPGGMELYINGRLAGQHTNAASFATLKGARSSYLGHGLSGNSTDEDFFGEIDEVRVWDHRRSAAQIREHMFKRLEGSESGLVHLWSFDDGTANDSGPLMAHGKLSAGARVGVTDLGLVAEPVTPMPPNPVAAPAKTDDLSATWWIAGALSAIVLVLAWLAFMFRRSGLGSEKLIGSSASRALEAGGSDVHPQELKERALAELTDFAKQSLVQGLYSQRETLLAAQKQAQQELIKLETRLASLGLSERIHAYETRIVELEDRLETRDGEVQELTRATLDLLRQRLATERRRQEFSRSN